MNTNQRINGEEYSVGKVKYSKKVVPTVRSKSHDYGMMMVNSVREKV